MRVDHRCRWVRHRLPLLAGGELGVEERRKVERHLIGCPGCRDRRDASTGALAALRSFAEESPSDAEAPSLWPALDLQIRQSRHIPPRPPWWDLPVPRSWGVFSLATGLGAVLAASLVPPSPPPPDRESYEVVAPVVAVETPMIEPEAPAPLHSGALPEAPPRQAASLSQNPIKPIEPPSSILRFDYDLDHGTPMGPGNRDPQRTF
jgi:anti-sigma factor RsiW